MHLLRGDSLSDVLSEIFQGRHVLPFIKHFVDPVHSV